MKTKESIEVKRGKIQEWPKVAIIILNWNGWKDTIECLESVFRNTYPNYQVIVVDNGSTDGSMEKIKAWADGKQEVLTPEPTHPLYHLSHPPIKKPIPYIYYTREEAEKGGNFKLEEKLTKACQRYRKLYSKKLNSTSPYPLIFIQTGDNLGFAGGNNVGLRYVNKKYEHDYAWLLNNDVVIDEDALIEMVKLGENNKKIGMVGSKQLYYDRPNIILVLGGTNQITYSSFGERICYSEEDKIRFNKNFEIKGCIYGASILINKRVIETTGIFDENYFLYAEEIDWCFRAYKLGWKLFCSGKSKIWHKDGASSGKSAQKVFFGRQSIRFSLRKFVIVNYYTTRNRLYFTKKHFSKYFAIAGIFIFLQIIGQIIGVILYDNYKFYRIRILLKGFIDGIKGKTGKTTEIDKYY